MDAVAAGLEYRDELEEFRVCISGHIQIHLCECVYALKYRHAFIVIFINSRFENMFSMEKIFKTNLGETEQFRGDLNEVRVN